MKRTFVFLAVLATLGGAAYLGSQLLAQQPVAPGFPQQQHTAPLPTTKIAFINLQRVIKEYNKYGMIQTELKAKAETFRVQIDTMAGEMKSLQEKEKTAPLSPDDREKVTKRIKELQRLGQDKSEEAQAALNKLQYDRLVTTYKEIQDVVSICARTRGIEVVMHYQDGIGEEVWMPAFFGKKMSNTALMPIYTAPGMDITMDVKNLLNERLAASAARPAVGGPAAGVTPH